MSRVKVGTLALGVVLSLTSACAHQASRSPSFAEDYKIEVAGQDEASLKPLLGAQEPAVADKDYDVAVIGGGLAGLTAALYLTERGHSVLLLEKEKQLGGLAAGGERSESEGFGVGKSFGIQFDRGAAYFTATYREEYEILKHLGQGNYKTQAIPEPIDSYLWNGHFYPGIWEEETLHKLPASFSLFKFFLKEAMKHGRIANQPIEEAKDLSLDKMSASQWVDSMVEEADRVAGAGERRPRGFNPIYERFDRERSQGRINRARPMTDVIDLLDLYCRSALGAQANQVSAMAFANFYISEIETRYTAATGTNVTAKLLENRLAKINSRFFEAKLSAAVAGVDQDDRSVAVTYVQNGRAFKAKAKFAVYASQLKFAPELISGFKSAAPEQAKLMAGLDYAHYSVHNVFVEGHPFRATYDTWVRMSDYKSDDFTDLILGRWMETKGYKDSSDVSTPLGGQGILSIYHPLTYPLAQKWAGGGYDQEQAKQIARTAVSRMLEALEPMKSQGLVANRPLAIKEVLTNRWPFSVHVPAKGHFEKARILRRPFKRIYFANNNLGTPAFEEALFRGHCAANNIERKIAQASGKDFIWGKKAKEKKNQCVANGGSERECHVPESWSLCPEEN